MRLVLIGLLGLLASCSDPLTSGTIINKHVKIHYGALTDTMEYYVVIQQGSRTDTIQVTEVAWKQAKNGMQWPFEVK